MKQQKNSKAILTGTMLLGLTVIAAASGTAAWMAAGVLGLAALRLLVTRREPKLMPVRINSRKHRS